MKETRRVSDKSSERYTMKEVEQKFVMLSQVNETELNIKSDFMIRELEFNKC